MDRSELTKISGTVENIIYVNEENGYTVLCLRDGSDEKITVTGYLPYAAPGERMLLAGAWVRHPTRGRQFKAELAERKMPEGAEAIYEYLSSGVIKGIGPATASVLVSTFGAETLEIIENNPQKLAAVRGIGAKKAVELSEALKKQFGLRRLMEFLNSFGIRTWYAMRLYSAYGSKALELVRENPYILSNPDIGAQFAEADALALGLGMSPDSEQRIAAAVLYELSYNTGNGHVFIPREKLADATARLLGGCGELIGDGIDALEDTGELVRETISGCNAVYLEAMYAAETETAERLLAMCRPCPPLETDIDSVIEELEREANIRYATLQRSALEMALHYRLCVVTGGPGTGKTTAVKGLIALFERMGLDVMLAAPTGRAAKRMTELTGREASTLHRLLEAGFSEEGAEIVFKRDADCPLKCGALILDECSMIDITLMHALLEALAPDCRLVLVGDADQLPSVGPGNVFSDIIRSGAAPVVKLEKIFRQTSDSRIVLNAHMINIGEQPNLTENKGDFFFLRRLDPRAALETVVELCSVRLPDKMGIPREEIQVLTPTRKGICGTAELNLALQARLNPPAQGKAEKKIGEITFREGDRVMQIRNNYDIIWTSPNAPNSGTGIYNGDIGYITSIDASAETVEIDFDGRLAVYGFDMLTELEHAWAMTVHKSQGSEYRAVVLCINGGAPQLLHRAVLYTAVTRAKELLVAVGDDATVRNMIQNYKKTRRYSGLRRRLAGETD